MLSGKNENPLCLFETTYVFLMLLHLHQTGYVSKHPRVGQDCWGDESLLTLADDRKPWNTSHFRPSLTPINSVIVAFTKFDLLINEHFKNIARCEKE